MKGNSVIELNAEHLREILHYNPDSGIFTWLWRADVGLCWNARYDGKVAGCLRNSNGRLYWYISIDGRRYGAHRLAFLYMTGKLPADLIDHRDNDGLNNCWANLREANHGQNGANAKLSKRNTSGLKGACFDKSNNRFIARIGDTHLGSYETVEAAHEAYLSAATAMFGEFKRVA